MSIEQLIKDLPECRKRTAKWFYENGMDNTSSIVDGNEFNLIVIDNENKMWNIELEGHDWKKIHEETSKINNDYYKPLEK